MHLFGALCKITPYEKRPRIDTEGFEIIDVSREFLRHRLERKAILSKLQTIFPPPNLYGFCGLFLLCHEDYHLP